MWTKIPGLVNHAWTIAMNVSWKMKNSRVLLHQAVMSQMVSMSWRSLLSLVLKRTNFHSSDSSLKVFDFQELQENSTALCVMTMNSSASEPKTLTSTNAENATILCMELHFARLAMLKANALYVVLDMIFWLTRMDLQSVTFLTFLIVSLLSLDLWINVPNASPNSRSLQIRPNASVVQNMLTHAENVN